MNEDPSQLHERELPEWLQRETDKILREEARDRAIVGVTALVLVVVFGLGLNAWLGMMGYGA